MSVKGKDPKPKHFADTSWGSPLGFKGCDHPERSKRLKTAPHTYIDTYIHTRTHTYILTYIHTYTHTYIHTHIHTYYLHTDRHTYRAANAGGRIFGPAPPRARCSDAACASLKASRGVASQALEKHLRCCVSGAPARQSEGSKRQGRTEQARCYAEQGQQRPGQTGASALLGRNVPTQENDTAQTLGTKP